MWRQSVPVVGFAAILVLAFLAPRYIELHCPWFARSCFDGLVLSLTGPQSLTLRFYLPAGIGSAAFVWLLTAFRPGRGARGGFLMVATIVLVGTVAALILPGGIVPDPFQCSVIPPGLGFAGGIACGVEGGHPDPRLALRYLVLLGALVSAGALLIQCMPPRRGRAAEPVGARVHPS
jgi:hypothetical protein